MGKLKFIIFIFIPCCFYAQNYKQVDSLTLLLKNTKHDTNKVNILHELILITQKNDLAKAIGYAKEEVKLSEALKFKLEKSYDDLAWLYKNRADYKKSLEIYFKSEKYSQHFLSPKKEQALADINSGLASVYSCLNNYDLAITKAENALQNYIILNDTIYIAITNLNIGNYLNHKGDFAEALNKYLSAEKLLIIQKDSIYLPDCYNNIGSILYQLKNYNEALLYYNKSLTLFSRIDSNNVFSIAVAQQNIGQCYQVLGDIKKGLEYCLKSMNSFEKLNDLVNLNNSYLNAAIMYQQLDDLKSSNLYYFNYAVLKDSIYDKETRNTIHEMAIKHETEKKEQENQVLLLGNKNKELIIYVAFGSCLVLLGLVFVIFYWYKLKQIALVKEKKLNELKSQFITIASHEFMTPLSTILTSTELIEKYDSPLDIEKKQNHFHRIKNAVNRLKEIFADFLTEEEINNGMIKNNPEKVDLKEFVEIIINENKLSSHIHTLEYYHSGTDKEVYIDKKLLKIAVINLLINAYKYSPRGGKIKISTTQSSDNCALIIKDQGIGIPKKDQEHIFEPFFRAKNAENIQGTGLGLNITQKLIHIMGGAIFFETTENEGTTFYVKIPK